MEGIEQNPVIYDLQFELLTLSTPLEIDKWLDDYIDRRYSLPNARVKEQLLKVWKILLSTCYQDNGYHENSVGTALAARPSLNIYYGSPCDHYRVFYDKNAFDKALVIMLSLADDLKDSDGYQFDLYDMTKQALSNRFDTLIADIKVAFEQKNLDSFNAYSQIAIDLLSDMDDFLSLRKDYNLSRWLSAAQKLATDEKERKYFDNMARTIITLWGDVNTTSALTDYAWREWSGLIKTYYLPRWQAFFDHLRPLVANKKDYNDTKVKNCFGRIAWKSNPFLSQLANFELNWTKTYSICTPPENHDVTQMAKSLAQKYNIPTSKSD